MKIFVKVILVLFIAFIIKSCVPREWLTVINQSDTKICAFVADGAKSYGMYPDTILPDVDLVADHYAFYIDPYKKQEFHLGGFSWNYEFQEILPQGILSVYIISADTIAKYGWTEMARNNNILKRYDLSQSELEAMDFKVTYYSE